jgi:hypothetical protein
MSVENPSLEELIGLCESESEKRKWFEGAATTLKGLKALNREREAAERARDQAFKDRDAALEEIATKQAKYEADMKAALADLERVTREKTDAATAAQAKAAAELAGLREQIEVERERLAQAEAARQQFVKTTHDEMTAIRAQLDSLRAERQAIRERVTAALQE